ncbi:MAG: 3'-5' exonuclease [Rubrivivax sp.]
MRWWPWHRRPAAGPGRWVVLDVESSGLDPQHDRLLAIAALGVRVVEGRLLVAPGDSFEVVLRQRDADATVPDRANILVHGIGVDAQRTGVEPAQALGAFQAFTAGAPLVAFHAGFDRILLTRALRDVLRRRLDATWLDLAELAPALLPQVNAHALDDWLALFGIRVAVRHQAAADTWATAELLQRLWPLALAQGCDAGFGALARLAASRRWLARS